MPRSSDSANDLLTRSMDEAPATLPPLVLPPLLLHAFQHGAACGLGWSTGKDSQALLILISQWFREQHFSGDLFAIHADLGRNDWPETADFAVAICQQLCLPLVVVRREKGDLLARWDERMATLAGTDTPFWSSKQQRYCTSDLKRSPINKHFRRYRLIVSAEGIRAAESGDRREKTPITVRREITGKRYRDLSPEAALTLFLTDRAASAALSSLWGDDLIDEEHDDGPRLALTWYPLFDWSLDQVWHACATSQGELDRRRALYKEGEQRHDLALQAIALEGWPCHPCYPKGASRLSCMLCSLGDLVNLQVGAQENPGHYRELVDREIASGWSFQPGRWLADICPDLLTDEQRAALARHPRRIAWLERRQKTMRRSDI